MMLLEVDAVPPMSTPSTPDAKPERTEYTIDELAAVARVPSRTIRFYQSRGALMPPEIRGRVAYYVQGHVDRLKLIAQLQDRGLRIDAIRDLLVSIDRGEVDLAEWLGIEQQVQAPWVNDKPRTVSEDEVYELAGTRRPGLLADLVRKGMLERHGDVYLAQSPALLSIALKLEVARYRPGDDRAGVGCPAQARGRTASELVEVFIRRAEEGKLEPRDLGQLDALRPLGMEAVRLIFGRAMEDELRKLYESGRMAKLQGRVNRGRKRA